VPIPEDLQALTALSSTGGNSLVEDLQNVAILAAGILYVVYERRPRGSARDDLLDVRRSDISNGNLGVFTTKYIPEGTVLGAFPGYFKEIEEALNSSK